MSDESSPSPDSASTPTSSAGFSGRRRNRSTRRSVKIADAVAKYGITIGGLFVIAALAALVAFLVSTVLPLFSSPDVDERLQVSLAQEGEIVATGLDEELKALWTLTKGGKLFVFQSSDGELVASDELSHVPVTAVAESRGAVAIGREDGTVLVGTIGGGKPEFRREIPDELAALAPGDTAIFQGGVADVTADGLVRITRVTADLTEEADAIKLDADEHSPVTHIDYLRDGASLQALVARCDNGNLYYGKISSKLNMMTGKRTARLSKQAMPASKQVPDDAPVSSVMIGRGGRDAYVLYENGFITRYSLSDKPRIVEERNLLENAPAGATVTAATMLTGDFTVIVGDSTGGVTGWFPARQANGGGDKLVAAHELNSQEHAVTSISVSGRDRQFVTGDDQGNLWLRHMTSEVTQAKLEMPGGSPALTTALAPRADAIVAVDTDGKLTVWNVDNPHPDGNLSAMFLPTHYEGYAGKEFVYQSSAAGDDAEPKLSLVPLIWGTLKATLYAMLFAVPIAILAAIYSSEFMQPSVRSVVKPVIEMMAGLPSVVLGFVAASLLAPYVEQELSGILITFAAVPVSVMIFGFLWQLVPPSETEKQGIRWAGIGYLVAGLAVLLYTGYPGHVAAVVYAAIGTVVAAFVLRQPEKYGPYMPFLVMGELIVVGLCIGLTLGPVFEALLFGSQFREWLLGTVDGWIIKLPGIITLHLPTWTEPAPGWVLVLTPIIAVTLVLVFNTYLRHRLGLFDGRDRTRTQLAVADFGRFIITFVLAVTIAIVIGLLFSAVGFDLRKDFAIFDSGILDRYDQRNALIVGMIMGFAVIPIIYTVSEDALNSVPNTLRSAALGAGATPWQTAIRVVLPVAISGIFSACMIGLGRAVGETMIVLMAAGNSATLHPNIFDGMRTMSANIATEMPEAEQNGTLYRVLFFSGLVLFAMTFLVNTLAEIVRARFRKRAFQL